MPKWWISGSNLHVSQSPEILLTPSLGVHVFITHFFLLVTMHRPSSLVGPSAFRPLAGDVIDSGGTLARDNNGHCAHS